MGRHAKPKTILYPFETCPSFLPKKKDDKGGDTIKEVSATISYSLRKSNAWNNLTPTQRLLYLDCKFQLYGQHPLRDKLTTDWEKENDKNVNIRLRFHFNEDLWLTKYGLYTVNTKRYFYKDMNALIENGLIRKIQSGQNTRTKSIYEFSDKWKELGEWTPKPKPSKRNKPV